MAEWGIGAVFDMSNFYKREHDCLELYTVKQDLSLIKHLGNGADGIVYLTDRSTAIKALRDERLYQNELMTYQRLQSRGVIKVGRFNVLQLVNHDPELLVIEMTFVVPPFVVDFAGVYLDRPPAYQNEPEIMNQWEADKSEQFGDDWPEVKLLMWELRQTYRIYLNDVKPGNVTVRQSDE